MTSLSTVLGLMWKLSRKKKIFYNQGQQHGGIYCYMYMCVYVHVHMHVHTISESPFHLSPTYFHHFLLSPLPLHTHTHPHSPSPPQPGLVAVGDEVVTYEDVMRMDPHPQWRRPIILIGEPIH